MTQLTAYSFGTRVPGTVADVRPRARGRPPARRLRRPHRDRRPGDAQAPTRRGWRALLILGACNPTLAHRALSVDPSVGTLLPCNIVLRQDGSGTIVEAMDPMAALGLIDDPAIQPIAMEARERLARVIAAWRSSHERQDRVRHARRRRARAGRPDRQRSSRPARRHGRRHRRAAIGVRPARAGRLHRPRCHLHPAQEATGGHAVRGPRQRASQRDEPPSAFTRIDVVHEVDGPSIDVEAVRRSIELSATRYCSVGATLSAGEVEIHHSYVVRSSGAAPVAADVVVLGPAGRMEVVAPVVAI